MKSSPLLYFDAARDKWIVSLNLHGALGGYVSEGVLDIEFREDGQFDTLDEAVAFLKEHMC